MKIWLLITITLIGTIASQLNSGQSVVAQSLLLWHIETVNSVESCFDISLSLMINNGENILHISYQDIATNSLMHSYRSNSGWVNEVVDNANGVGKHSSIALDSLGYPHISYRDGVNNALKYARWNGKDWQITSIGNTEFGWFTSLGLDNNDQAHVAYLGNHQPSGNQTPKYAFWNGNQWQISVIDEIFSDSGISLTLDTLDNPHVSYHGFYELRYAVYSNTQWITTTVDSLNHLPVGYYSSIALDNEDQPHISYGLYGSHGAFGAPLFPDALKYAQKLNDHWITEIVDSLGQVGAYSSLALSIQNQPHISYFDSDNAAIKYAYWEEGEWILRVVDSPVQMNGYTAIEIDQQGQPHLVYCDEQSNVIKYAQPVSVNAKGLLYLPIITK